MKQVVILLFFSPRLFVANLSYTVDERKLREVFRLAGRVVMVELNRDKEVNTLKTLIFNTQYMTNSTLVSPVKMEYG